MLWRLRLTSLAKCLSRIRARCAATWDVYSFSSFGSKSSFSRLSDTFSSPFTALIKCCIWRMEGKSEHEETRSWKRGRFTPVLGSGRGVAYPVDVQQCVSQVVQESLRLRLLELKVRQLADHLQQGLLQLQTLVYLAQGNVLERLR